MLKKCSVEAVNRSSVDLMMTPEIITGKVYRVPTLLITLQASGFSFYTYRDGALRNI